jgi:ectoine hydroxylase-related dioxygenase (phytanoyl-CoA dioxygenase family)
MGGKDMERLVLSSLELSSGKLNPETLERACNQVMLNGFVVLQNAVSTELIDKIYEDWIALTHDLLENDPSKTDVGSSEFRKNRIRMDIPFRAPYIDSKLVANPFALPIIERILGEDCRVFYYSADAPMPGSDYQVVHADYRPFFPESDIVLPTAGLVVNFPLIEVTESNGPMDVWPSTHLMPEKAYSGSRVRDAAGALPPTSMLTPKGSLLIRDVRMWHRGTPNRSNQIRPNLGLIYGRSWWDGAFYPQETLGITRPSYERLSERAKQLFRLEPIAE